MGEFPSPGANGIGGMRSTAQSMNVNLKECAGAQAHDRFIPEGERRHCAALAGDYPCYLPCPKSKTWFHQTKTAAPCAHTVAHCRQPTRRRQTLNATREAVAALKTGNLKLICDVRFTVLEIRNVLPSHRAPLAGAPAPCC